jgi:ribonuclease VapC
LLIAGQKLPKNNLGANMLYVMDASAMLALMQAEKGWEIVDDLIQEQQCVASCVNVAEAGTKMIDKGLAPSQLKRTLEELNIKPVDFDLEQSTLCAELRLSTKFAGLSLGDRACLALTKLMDGTAVTSDRAWLDIAETTQIKVLMIR